MKKATYRNSYGNFVSLETNFRNMLVKMERENVSLKIGNATLKATNDQQQKKVSCHMCKYF